MSDETKIFTKNDKNGDKCASGGQESGLKLIFERGVAILVRPWRFPGQPKKFVFFSIKVGTINSGTSLDSREQFKKTGKLEIWRNQDEFQSVFSQVLFLQAVMTFPIHVSRTRGKRRICRRFRESASEMVANGESPFFSDFASR